MSEWKKAKIGDFLKRKRIPIQLEADKEYKLITIKLYHKGVFLRGNKKGSEIHSNMYKVSKGDFILSGIDARNGAFGIVPDSLDGAIVTNDFWYFDIDESIIKKEFFLWLTSTPVFLDACQKASMGETQRIRLQKDAFFNYKIKCPSIEYQDEFLARINPIIEKIKIIQSETEKQTEYAKLLRQNILQQAIEGKLTADWRKQNPVQKGNPDYDAEALFEQIQKERNNEKKQTELSPITEKEKLFEIPDGWKWVRLGEIINLLSGRDFEPSEYNDKQKGTPYITEASNFGENGIIINRWTETPKCIAKFGDLLLVCKGSGYGTLAYADFKEAHIARQVMSITTVSELISLKYIEFILRANFQYLKSQGKGLIPGIDRETVLNICAGLPSLLEQEEIVKSVEKHLQTVFNIESQITEREQLAKQLMQSILKDTFEE